VPAALAARLWLVPAGWGMVQSQVFPSREAWGGH